MDPCLDQPSQLNHEIAAISQPRGRLDMLIPVVCHPPCDIVPSIELAQSSDVNRNCEISFDGGYPLPQRVASPLVEGAFLQDVPG